MRSVIICLNNPADFYPSSQLEGKIITTTTYRGAISGQFTHPLLSRTVTIYSSHLKNFRWNHQHNFSISFPASVHTEVGTSQLPPSFSTRLLNIHCEVAYTLKFDMVRKGLRRHESYDASSQICLIALTQLTGELYQSCIYQNPHPRNAPCPAFQDLRAPCPSIQFPRVVVSKPRN